MCGSGSLATALAHRDEDEERAERRVGDVGEDVVEVGEAEHEVTAEGVVEARLVAAAVRRRADIRQHHLQWMQWEREKSSEQGYSLMGGYGMKQKKWSQKSNKKLPESEQ